MTFPAPRYLKDDPWFGPAVLSDKSKEELKEVQVAKVKETIHEILYKRASRTKLTCYRDQPWISGAGFTHPDSMYN